MRFVSASPDDNVVKVWELTRDNFEVVHVLQKIKDGTFVSDVAWSQCIGIGVNRIAVSEQNGTVTVWTLDKDIQWKQCQF